MGMSHHTPGLSDSPATQGTEVPRPQLAGALATALKPKAATVPQAVAAVAATLATDVLLCDQLGRLPTGWRVALRRAESEATDKLGVGLSPVAAHRLDLDDGCRLIIVHGDGWSLIGRTPRVLLFLLDVAPGLVIDRSRAEGAGELVSGLAERLV
jgi:hypothetical protein